MQAVVVESEEQIIAEIIEHDIKEHGEKVPSLKLPKDKYFLCHLVFFLLGIAHFLPMTFFNAANNFWMYKFRNLSDPTMSAGNRTTLQTHYASIQMVVSTVPTLLIGIFNIVYAYKFKLMSRIYVTLIVEVCLFYLCTAFVKINTDNYQTGFFIIVMGTLGTLTAANMINIVASALLYPRFPHTYMKTSMLGEGVASLLGDILNVISVAVFDEVTDSTLMYFLVGSIVMTATLVLTMVIARTEFFKHCLTSIPEDHKTGMPKLKEITDVLWKIRLTVFAALMMLLGMSASHTSITSLVVSEQTTGAWASRFFSPVITFFWADLCGVVGRFLATHSPLQRLPDVAIGVLATLRTCVLVPLIWFCNAQPRKHLSVLFSHDYEYALILGVFMMLNGFLQNMAMLLIPKKTTRREAEVAYIIFSLIMGVLSSATSPIGIFIVNIL